MSSLEVSKNGMIWLEKDGVNTMEIKNNTFFRKGKVGDWKVGDWKNHLTHEMAMQLDQIFEQKLTGSGLTFKIPLPSPSQSGD
ncbi:hypothetical protein SO802_000372 [Lithocarpus litseifolius]|uniref:Sulfotransferase n=1 Tax=Lithocarpus litseifolius TaxID=425828 RepID=A0AAW2DUT8_9ROSI